MVLLRALAVIVALAAVGLTAAPATDDGSLESFLKRARVERDALQERLATTVDDIVQRLESDRPLGRQALDGIRSELDLLGPDAAPLLLRKLDEGTDATDAKKLRAHEIEATLTRSAPAGIVRDLIRGTRSYSEPGRRRAIRLLGVVPESDRAGEHLSDLLKTAEGPDRLACIAALATLRTDRFLPLLHDALSDEDPAVVRTVLVALLTSDNAGAAPAVLNLTRDPIRASIASNEIVAFWLAFPTQVNAETVNALIRLTRHSGLKATSTVTIIDALPTLAADHAKLVRRKLSESLASATPIVKEATLICLTLLGERTARRDLMRPLDDTVRENEDWFKGYIQRAEVRMRIHDYSNAAKDFEYAIELLGKRSRQSAYTNIWTDLARCYILAHKLAKAAATLDAMGMSDGVKAKLRVDPVFAELVGHSRHGKLFD